MSWDSPNSRPPFLGCHKIKRTCMAFQFTKEIRRITKSHQWDSGRRSSWNRRSDYQGRWVLLKIDDCNQEHLFRYNKNQMQWLWFTATTYSIISHCIFWHCSLNVFILWNFIYVYTMYLNYIYPSSSLQLSPGFPPNPCVCVCVYSLLIESN